MNRHVVAQAVLRLQAQQIRDFLSPAIQEFEVAFDDILRTGTVFLLATEKVAQSPSLTVVDQESVLKSVCQFLESSNAILGFLDWQQREIGLASGGDVSLDKQIKEAQALVQKLLSALLLHKKAEDYPGKEIGFVYNEDVKVLGGFILHKHAHVDASDIPDPNDDNEDMGKLIQYWHTENVFHPLRRVPGTPWHKFFGNLIPGPIMSPALFRERKQLPSFRVLLPTTITWLEPELVSNYDKYRNLFERFRRLPGTRLPEFIKEAIIRKIQRRLSNHFRGWLRFEYDRILHFEDLSDLPCPEYDTLGAARLEALNAEINAPALAGIALMGAEIHRVPVFLEVEGRKYCLEFDGQWDP